MGEIRACVFVGGCGQRGRESGAEKFFPEGFAARDGVSEGRVWGEMERTTPARRPGVCISLREASATGPRSSALKVEITQQGTCIKMLSPCFVPHPDRE